MALFFKTLFYTPLYNGLIFLVGALPFADAGVVVIIFTVLVKLLLFPLSKMATVTQFKMKQTSGELAKIKEKYKNNKEEEARAVMTFYKDNKINPFSGFLIILIQLPIVIALYWVFYKGGLPAVDANLLYPFVKAPTSVDMNFLGLIDIGGKSLLLAILVGITQFFQTRYSMPPLPPRTENGSFKEELSRSMGLQMRYILPFFVAFVAYGISGAVALYWTTSNLFAIGQELYIRRHLSVNGKLGAFNSQTK
jgi:YidC/Oxa1 family membrane protein insertase